ncbi:MAG: DUF1003 domain-containing protein [Acetobacteraceae bacterium]|nr:DUF1003 domain-containing protein [Acetobacteraceae bacterium]
MKGFNDLAHRLHERELQLLYSLRHTRHEQPTAELPELTLGQRILDSKPAIAGSWRFIVIQSTTLLAWMMLNVTAYVRQWDPVHSSCSISCCPSGPARGALRHGNQNRQPVIDRAEGTTIPRSI